MNREENDLSARDITNRVLNESMDYDKMYELMFKNNFIEWEGLGLYGLIGHHNALVLGELPRESQGFVRRLQLPGITQAERFVDQRGDLVFVRH